MLFWLDRNNTSFPPLQSALRAPDGLLALGGDLSSQRLLSAYRHGCFPWYTQGQPLMWWSPNPRTVLFPQELHIPRSLKKTLRRNSFHITYDQDFAAVIAACAEPRSTQSGTWITPAIQQAYCRLHQLGHAHSVEVWHQKQLVGGLYGIAIGQIFFGESMFARINDASKVGFATLVQDLQAAGFVMIDCQMQTSHLERFGARAISRHIFADYLAAHLDTETTMQWGQP